MPLKKGYSRETFDSNVIEMLNEGHPRNQALAAAYKSARDSFFAKHPHGALPLWLTPKGGKRMRNPSECKPCRSKNPVPLAAAAYKAASMTSSFARAPNPVPPSKKVQLRNAADLYSRFTGHEAELVDTIDKPVLPDVMLIVGDIDGILYTTVRDGVTEKYIHKFKKNCRPLFTVSHDGKQLFMLGGSYDFTELGIVDKT